MKTLNGKFEYNNARTGLRSVAGFKLDVQKYSPEVSRTTTQVISRSFGCWPKTKRCNMVYLVFIVGRLKYCT